MALPSEVQSPKEVAAAGFSYSALLRPAKDSLPVAAVLGRRVRLFGARPPGHGRAAVRPCRCRCGLTPPPSSAAGAAGRPLALPAAGPVLPSAFATFLLRLRP